MSKPRKYIVVLDCAQGEVKGIPIHHLKYVSGWPENASQWGARFETSPNKEDAVKFGRDTALEVARTIRMRNSSFATAMVEEA